MTFQENIDRLTVDTHIFINDSDIGQKLVTRPPLIPQLRTAVFRGGQTGGGATQFTGTLALSAGALDLLDEIDRQAAEALRSVDSRPTPYGTTETYVRLWSAATAEDRMFPLTIKRQHPDQTVDKWREQGITRSAVYFDTLELPAWMVAQRWVDQIDQFFNPASTSEIRGKCPACGEKDTYRMKDGEWVRSTALAFIRNESGESTEARCAACVASWTPDQFGWLLSVLAADDPEKVPMKPLKSMPRYCAACYHAGHTDYLSPQGPCECECRNYPELALHA